MKALGNFRSCILSGNFAAGRSGGSGSGTGLAAGGGGSSGGGAGLAAGGCCGVAKAKSHELRRGWLREGGEIFVLLETIYRVYPNRLTRALVFDAPSERFSALGASADFFLLDTFPCFETFLAASSRF